MLGRIRSVFAVIFLPIITCGIYSIYWIYSITNELNDFLETEDTSGGMVILYSVITCGIYGIYWYYKMGKKIAEAQQKSGMESCDDSILYLILCLVGFHIVAMAIMQYNLNNVWNSTWKKA